MKPRPASAHPTLKWSEETLEDYRDMAANYAQKNRIVVSITSLGDYFENEGDRFGFSSNPAAIYYIPHDAPTPSDELVLEVEDLAAQGKSDEIVALLLSHRILKKV